MIGCCREYVMTIMVPCCEASQGRHLLPSDDASPVPLHLPRHTEPQLCPAALLQTCPQALTCTDSPKMCVKLCRLSSQG